MKTTQVSIAAGVAPTLVPANIPAKFVKIVQDSDQPTESLMVQMLNTDGTYSPELTFAPGLPIRLKKPWDILAPPAGYFSASSAAWNYAKIRTASGNPVTLRMEEFELIPPGED